jgi:hypothetical protein
MQQLRLRGRISEQNMPDFFFQINIVSCDKNCIIKTISLPRPFVTLYRQSTIDSLLPAGHRSSPAAASMPRLRKMVVARRKAAEAGRVARAAAREIADQEPSAAATLAAFRRRADSRAGTLVSAATWEHRAELLASWNAACERILGDMKVCYICGVTFFGYHTPVLSSGKKPYVIVPPSAHPHIDVAPYGLKNIDVHLFCTDGDGFVCCPTCLKLKHPERDPASPFTIW